MFLIKIAFLLAICATLSSCQWNSVKPRPCNGIEKFLEEYSKDTGRKNLYRDTSKVIFRGEAYFGPEKKSRDNGILLLKTKTLMNKKDKYDDHFGIYITAIQNVTLDDKKQHKLLNTFQLKRDEIGYYIQNQDFQLLN